MGDQDSKDRTSPATAAKENSGLDQLLAKRRARATEQLSELQFVLASLPSVPRTLQGRALLLINDLAARWCI